MRDLVGDHRAADARVVGPAVHAGLEERAVDDQLAATVEQVEQARRAVRVRRTRTPSRRPATASADARQPSRHGRGSAPSPCTRSCWRVGLPLLRRHDRGCGHRDVLIVAPLRRSSRREPWSGSHRTMARRPTNAAPAEKRNGISHSSTGTPAMWASITTAAVVGGVLVVAVEPGQVAFVAAERRTVEPLPHRPQRVEAARVRGVGVEHVVAVTGERAHAGLLARPVAPGDVLRLELRRSL